MAALVAWLLVCSLGCFGSGCSSLNFAPRAPEEGGAAEARAADVDEIPILDVGPTAEPSAFFELEGKPFCFAGANNYYLTFKSRKMVDDVLTRALALNLKVIRLWAFIDRGSLDGGVPSIDGDGTKDGVYFQFWDAKRKKPAFNDGESGLIHLDYVLHRARALGLKLTLVLTNNWQEFGGMDQYLSWYGLDEHHLFYSDTRVKAAFKAWTTHLVERQNRIDGVRYRDDPAIFAWELANEPRCRNFTRFDRASGWDTSTIVAWADEMSSHLRSIDPNHLIGVGDEGFLNGGGAGSAYQARDGVDHRALSALPNIDFATFHLYPEAWNVSASWGNRWIEDHIQLARQLGKPSVLEEYGMRVPRATPEAAARGFRRRAAAYTNWNQLMLQRGGSAALFWILVGNQDSGQPYPDYDDYSVYSAEAGAELLRGFARAFPSEARACQLAPVPLPTSSRFVSVRRGTPRSQTETGGAQSSRHRLTP